MCKNYYISAIAENFKPLSHIYSSSIHHNFFVFKYCFCLNHMNANNTT